MLRYLYTFILLFLYLAGMGPLHGQSNRILFRSEGKIPQELVTTELEKLRNYEKEDKRGDRDYYRSLVISMQNMIENNMLIYGNASQTYMQGLVNDILLKNGLKQQIKLFQINSTIINAFSIEPGYIFISTGMVANMLSEDNLYMVLCHEVAHITNEHSKRFHETKRKLSRKEEMNTLDPVGDFIKKVLSYSREQEKEADVTGIKYYANSGRPAESVVKTYSLLSDDSMQYAPWVIAFFSEMGLNPDGTNSLSETFHPGKIYLKEEEETDTGDAELWSSHPSPENRLVYIKEILKTTSFANGDISNSGFGIIHKQCLLNYALLCKINGEFLNALHAGVLFRYLYGQNREMDLLVSSAIANEVLYTAKPQNNKAQKKTRKKPSAKANKNERDFSWVQPGVAKCIAVQLEKYPNLAQTIIGTYAYRIYLNHRDPDILLYAAAIRYRLVRRNITDTTSANGSIMATYMQMADDSMLPGLGRRFRAAEWTQDSLNELEAARTLKEGSQSLYAYMRSQDGHKPIDQVKYFQLHTLINRSSESNVRLKQRLIKYTKKEVERINALTEIKVNDSFIERGTLTTEILNRSEVYTLYLREKYNRTNKALPLLMEQQLPNANSLQNDILVDVFLLPDIMKTYYAGPRRSVLMLINVQRLDMDEPLYFIVRINKGKLHRGVLGNYIYNAIKQAE